MKKFINIILALSLTISTVFGTDAVMPDSNYIGADSSSIDAKDQTKLKAPLMNLFQSTDWGLFLQEFEITFELGFCGKGLDKAIGFKAHMIEPIGYFENTKKPLYFPFADLDLGGNVIKSGHSRSTIKSDAGRDEFIWSHFIYVPIFGIIFKKSIPVFCFANGDLALPLINEFFPPYSKDIMYKNLILPMIAMYTPQGLLSTVINCGATTADNALHGFGQVPPTTDGEKTSTTTTKKSQSSFARKGEEYLKFIRNTMYFSVGCLGFAPVGGYIEAQDPGTDNDLLLYQAINILHGASSFLPSPFLYKQTNFGTSGSKNGSAMITDSMCSPQRYPLGIESQYVPQRAFPTVGGPHELGMTPVVSTTGANVPGSKDSFVNVVWERRDYYAFAYFCPGGGNKKK